jgi:hypothetical protein
MALQLGQDFVAQAGDQLYVHAGVLNIPVSERVGPQPYAFTYTKTKSPQSRRTSIPAALRGVSLRHLVS